MNALWIGLFGLAGVFSRYFVDQLLPRTPGVFPTGTFAINIVGSFLAGAIYVWGFERNLVSPELRTGILVGFLGGFTTFSAFSLQAATLVEGRLLGTAVLYAVLSPLAGIIAALAGLKTVRALL